MYTVLVVAMICGFALSGVSSEICDNFTEWSATNPNDCAQTGGFCSKLLPRYRVSRCTGRVHTEHVQCFASDYTMCYSGGKTGSCILGFCVVGLPACVWSSWSEPSPCEAISPGSCTGTSQRTRSILAGNAFCSASDSVSNLTCSMPNGTQCSGLLYTGNCYLGVCAYSSPSSDCTWSSWTDWSTCTSTSDNANSCEGTSMRNRTIQQAASGSGNPCQGPIAQKKICNIATTINSNNINTASCILNNGNGICIDGQCQPDCSYGCWSCWSSWSPCEENCGTRTRTRTIRDTTTRRRTLLEQELTHEQSEQNNEQQDECTGSTNETSACVDVGCPGYKIQPEIIINIYDSLNPTHGTEEPTSASSLPATSQPMISRMNLILIVIPAVLVAIIIVVVIIILVKKHQRTLAAFAEPPANITTRRELTMSDIELESQMEASHSVYTASVLKMPKLYRIA